VNLAVLLRLLPGPLAESCLVGEVEVVRTGEKAVFHGAEQLVAYLREREPEDNRDQG
jgi:hypothetical protein